MMPETEEKSLKLMKFWLVGTFIIVVAVQVALGFIIPGLIKEINFWLGILIAAVLCGAWYFLYKVWINRQKA